MENEIKNGSTAKGDSKVGTSPAIPLASEIEALEAELLAEKQAQKQKREKLAALKLHARREKVAHRDAEKEREVEAMRCRIYKTLWAAKNQDRLALALSIVDQFRTDSIDQQYTLAAMKSRAEAAVLAGGKAPDDSAE